MKRRGSQLGFVATNWSESLRAVPPTTPEGIEKYLGSGMVKGIGPIFAKRLVGKFGAEVLAVIEERWADLELVEGIGPKRRQRIVQAWAEGKRIAYPQDWYSLTMAPR